jgi:sugar phosphate isomerase/epimerase
MMEDPVAAARRLGPYTVATHTKDLDACRHVRPEEWYFFSSVPVGAGLIDMPGVVKALKASGYDGMLAVESDHHKDHQDEDKLVAQSIAYLKRLLAELDN